MRSFIWRSPPSTEALPDTCGSETVPVSLQGHRGGPLGPGDLQIEKTQDLQRQRAVGRPVHLAIGVQRPLQR